METRNQSETMKRYFLDWEFIEDGRTIDPISIGVVCEDGREFYAEVDEVDWSKANPWVLENVKPHLLGTSWMDMPGGRHYSFDDVLTKDEIAIHLLQFTTDGMHRPEFWAYYADYDWIATCQLYGTMMDLPSSWPKFCMDLKQLTVDLGNPELPKQESTQHNAINDAQWNFNAYKWLQSYANNIAGGLYQK